VTAAEAQALRRGTRIVAAIGIVLLLPRIVVSWVVLDRTPAPVIASLLFVLGVLVLGLLLNGTLRMRLGSRWWTALIGFVALVVGALATSAVTTLGSAVGVSGYSGVVVPVRVGLTNWLFLVALAVWLLGAVLLVSAALGGLMTLASGRRARA
jgi:hypothetical protein